jgi:hypothetical protein
MFMRACGGCSCVLAVDLVDFSCWLELLTHPANSSCKLSQTANSSCKRNLQSQTAESTCNLKLSIQHAESSCQLWIAPSHFTQPFGFSLQITGACLMHYQCDLVRSIGGRATFAGTTAE